MALGYINTNQYNNTTSQSAYDMAAQVQSVSTSSNESIFSAMKGVGAEVVGSVLNPVAIAMAPLQLQDPITSGYIKNSYTAAGYECKRPVLFEGKEIFGKQVKGFKAVKTNAGQEVAKAQKALETAKKTNNIQTPWEQLKNFKLGETISNGTSLTRDAYRSFAKSNSNLLSVAADGKIAGQADVVKKIAETYGVKLNAADKIDDVFNAIDKGDDVLKAAQGVVKNSKDAQKLADMARSVKMLGGKNYLASKNPLDWLGNGYRKLIGNNKVLRKVPILSVVMNTIGQVPDLMISAQYGAGEFGKQALRSTALVATNVVGYEVGGVIGAKLGAIVGTAICPVIGTAIGSIVGSIAGGTLFGSVGTRLVNWIADNTIGKSKAKEAQEQAEKEAQMIALQQAQSTQNPFRQAA